jgi:2-isopropylmalate synthase
MTPQSIGRSKSTLVLGRLSGHAAVKFRLKELGYKLKESEFDKVFEKFLELADKKKEVFNEDLHVLIEDELNILPEIFSLVYFSVVTGNKVIPTATVKLRKNSTMVQEAATGDGPVDAVYKAIEKITDTPVKLVSYSLNAVTHGKDAMGTVTISVERNNKQYRGHGVATDIIEASAHAFLNAINRILFNSYK